jgi:hypothetical protein
VVRVDKIIGIFKDNTIIFVGVSLPIGGWINSCRARAIGFCRAVVFCFKRIYLGLQKTLVINPLFIDKVVSSNANDCSGYDY